MDTKLKLKKWVEGMFMKHWHGMKNHTKTMMFQMKYGKL